MNFAPITDAGKSLSEKGPDEQDTGNTGHAATFSRAKRILLTFLSVVFLLAALSKIANLDSFSENLQNHLHLRPKLLAHFVSYAVPAFELALAARLWALKNPYETAFLTLCVLLLFTLVSLYAALEGASGLCGCFGETLGSHGSPWIDVARNLLLIGFNALFFLQPVKR